MNWMYVAFNSVVWSDILLVVIVSIIVLSMIGASIAFFWVSNTARTEINVARKRVRKRGK